MSLTDLNVIAQIGASVATIITLIFLVYQLIKDKSNLFKKIVLFNYKVKDTLSDPSVYYKKDKIFFQISLYNNTKYPLIINEIVLYTFLNGKFYTPILIDNEDKIFKVEANDYKDILLSFDRPQGMLDYLMNKIHTDSKNKLGANIETKLIISFTNGNKRYYNHLDYGHLWLFYHFPQSIYDILTTPDKIQKWDIHQKIVGFQTDDFLPYLKKEYINFDFQIPAYSNINIKKFRYSLNNYIYYLQQIYGMRNDFNDSRFQIYNFFHKVINLRKKKHLQGFYD